MIRLNLILVLLALVLLAFAGNAWPMVDDFEPPRLSIEAYAWILGISLLSAVAQFTRAHMRGRSIAKAMGDLVIDLLAAMFIGFMVLLYGVHNDWQFAETVLTAGALSHLGARLLVLGERIIVGMIRNRFGNYIFADYLEGKIVVERRLFSEALRCMTMRRDMDIQDDKTRADWERHISEVWSEGIKQLRDKDDRPPEELIL